MFKRILGILFITFVVFTFQNCSLDGNGQPYEGMEPTSSGPIGGGGSNGGGEGGDVNPGSLAIPGGFTINYDCASVQDEYVRRVVLGYNATTNNHEAYLFNDSNTGHKVAWNPLVNNIPIEKYFDVTTYIKRAWPAATFVENVGGRLFVRYFDGENYFNKGYDCVVPQ